MREDCNLKSVRRGFATIWGLGLLLALAGFRVALAQPGAAPGSAPAAMDRQWAQWRGPMANGVAPRANPPVTWNEQKNVRWKIRLPGKAHSSPVVFGDRLFFTAAAPVGEGQAPVYDDAPGTHDNVAVTHRHEFVVVAARRGNGEVIWRRTVREEFPHEGGHSTGSLASNSPIADGERVYAFFGSRGLFCLDFDGKVLWEKDLGRMRTLHAHGEGSSPVVVGENLIVCWDHEGASFIYAFDKRTGRERWRKARDEITSWSTPLAVEHGGRWQVVVSATKKIRAYDAETGAELWECAGLTDNVVASPVHWKGMIIAGNSYYVQRMVAIHLEGAKGDISGTTNVAWRLNRLTPYVPSPLVYDDTLYVLRHNQNVLVRFHPGTGVLKGEPLRLDGIRDFIFSSPVGAAGRIYVTGRDGTTVVLRHDAGNAVLAVNRLDDTFSASAAMADGELYLKGEQFLYCIAEE